VAHQIIDILQLWSAHGDVLDVDTFERSASVTRARQRQDS
jgi:hypothetical protein